MKIISTLIVCFLAYTWAETISDAVFVHRTPEGYVRLVPLRGGLMERYRVPIVPDARLKFPTEIRRETEAEAPEANVEAMKRFSGVRALLETIARHLERDTEFKKLDPEQKRLLIIAIYLSSPEYEKLGSGQREEMLERLNVPKEMLKEGKVKADWWGGRWRGGWGGGCGGGGCGWGGCGGCGGGWGGCC